jgi:hypothetical protein
VTSSVIALLAALGEAVLRLRARLERKRASVANIRKRYELAGSAPLDGLRVQGGERLGLQQRYVERLDDLGLDCVDALLEGLAPAFDDMDEADRAALEEFFGDEAARSHTLAKVALGALGLSDLWPRVQAANRAIEEEDVRRLGFSRRDLRAMRDR